MTKAGPDLASWLAKEHYPEVQPHLDINLYTHVNMWVSLKITGPNKWLASFWFASKTKRGRSNQKRTPSLGSPLNTRIPADRLKTRREGILLDSATARSQIIFKSASWQQDVSILSVLSHSLLDLAAEQNCSSSASVFCSTRTKIDHLCTIYLSLFPHLNCVSS